MILQGKTIKSCVRGKVSKNLIKHNYTALYNDKVIFILGLQNIPALHYRGAFKSIDELPIDKYDTFLYTSRSDGLPNILLEMSARGIPIIASDAGGVGDFIKPNQTGLLIKEQNNPEPYLDALQYASSHPSEMTKLAKGARTLCEKRHSFEAYLQSMRRHFKE